MENKVLDRPRRPYCSQVGAQRSKHWCKHLHYTYDANGNLTGDGSLSYGWDSRNRLVSLAGAATASFAYDAGGRRSGKTINGTTANFVYDGANVVQELAGGTPSATLLTGLEIDEVFSRTDGLGARTLVTDALGSTVAFEEENEFR
jgi:uncharacterized protein RhaS with RHS repeats